MIDFQEKNDFNNPTKGSLVPFNKTGQEIRHISSICTKPGNKWQLAIYTTQ